LNEEKFDVAQAFREASIAAGVERSMNVDRGEPSFLLTA